MTVSVYDVRCTATERQFSSWSKVKFGSALSWSRLTHSFIRHRTYFCGFATRSNRGLMDELRPSTPLYLPESLLPLTIHRQLAPHKSIVHKTQPLFSYSYYEHVPSQDGQPAKQEKVVKVWESPIEGMIQSWQVNEGQRISQAG